MSRTRPFVFAMCALAAGCGEPATVPAKPIAGSYALVGVNLAPLPARDTLNGELLTFVSGRLTVTDSSYVYTVCVDSTGVVDKVCGAGQLSITDSGLVWWSPRGPSFVGTRSHISRGLIANRNRDSLLFNANDLATSRFLFVR